MKKLEKKIIEDIFALTPMQEGMLFRYLKDPGSDYYFEQLSLEISGEINTEFFEKAWNFVIKTNEMLRTVFRWEKVDKPLQIILKEHRLRTRYYDFSDCDFNEIKKRLEEVKVKDREHKFDLQEVPFRVTLCKVGDDKYEMIISNHHILYDGWSNGIILKEFFQAYRESSKGVVLNPLVKPAFKEFVKWMRTQDTANQEEYWNEYLKDFVSGPDTRTGKKRKELKHTDNYKFKFPGELKRKLDVFIKDHNITTASFLYSVWGVLLQNYHAVDDIIFDATVSGRSASTEIKGIENIVGLFINTLPLRIQTFPTETAAGFLSRIYHMLRHWSEFENSALLPVREILDKCSKESLFDSVVVIENYPLDRLTVKETAPLTLHSFSFVERTFYDLTVIITTLNGFEFNITYDNDRFDRTVISRLSGHLISIAEEMVTYPGKVVSEIDIWKGEESEKFLELIHTGRVTGPGIETGYTAPRDEVEKKLVEVWSNILNIKQEEIGIDDNFFDFGGHSLKASQSVSRIHRVFEVKVPLAEIFHRPTIRELAGFIRDKAKQEYIPVPLVEEKEYYDVSPGQRRLYMLQQLNPGSTAYNGPWSMMLDGPIDEERIKQSFKRLIERHEMLRTSFVQQNGEPVQKIHEHAEFEIEYYEIKEVKSCIKSFTRPFNLSQAPLLRVGLIKVEPREHILVMDMHHIITDGTSSAVLAGELSRLYRGEDLPPLKLQYKDFSQWRNRRIAAEELKKQEEYWLQHLSGELPVLNLPIDYPRPRMQRFDGERILFELDDVLAGRLHILMKETGTTLYMSLMSILNIVLGWYCGREDIVVGTPIAGRNHEDIENTVGFFLETLAIRNRPGADKTFTKFLQEVKNATLNAYENRDYPFSLLIKRLSPTNDLSRNPLFDVMLNVLNQSGMDFELEGVNVVPYEPDIKVSKVDITLEAVEQYGKIRFELEYCTALFKRQTMERFAGYFLNTLRETIFKPGIRLGEIEIIEEDEKRQILAEFNNTAGEYDEKRTVVDYFETCVAGVPDRIAVIGPHVIGPITYGQITYRELDNRSEQIAFRLREKGAAADTIVGIMLGPSLEMITGIWGILKAGGAYLPIDPEYPEERVNYMLADSETQILVSDHLPPAARNLFEKRFLDLQKLLINEKFFVGSRGAVLQKSPPCSANLAYVIYTSGSTGRPKGVMVRHKNLMGYTRTFREEFKIKETDVVMQQASISFDVFVEEVYPCLLAGGTLAVPPRRVIRDTALLVDFIATQKITVIDCSPLLLNELNGWTQVDKPNPLKTLHTVISGGDVLKGEYVTNLLKTCLVYNTYGPTETTVCASYHRLTGREGAAVPIGKPITNYQVYILDKSLRLLPVGVVGEIVIGGVGVTAGYLNRPGLTAERFISPLNRSYRSYRSYKTNKKLYQTGDLGRWLPDGSIEFIGRKDRQVKIRGYRIELGEIETRLLAHEDIKEISVLSIGEQWLCAYFTARKEKNIKEMREFLSRDLPAYMIPAYFVQLERMPIGAGGKIDIKALPKPAEYGLDTGVEYVLPQSEIENKLVNFWQELLERERIGIMDDFFDVGGDSILVNRCIARIREEFHAEIPLREFFERPFIKALAGEIEKQERQLSSIKPAKREGEIPLSFAQERLWFLQELDAGNTAYFVPRVIRMKGKPDVYLMERTFTEIIRRHEILRTVFPCVDGQPVQRIRPPYRFKIPVLDWSRLEKEEQESQVSHFLNEEGQRPFDFEKGPLLRVNLLKLGEAEHLFVLTEHHLVHDGWTQGVLLNEFINIFSAYSEGRNHDLPELPIQYADYVIWQRTYLQGERLNRHLEYWQEKLSGSIPVLELPGDRPRPAVISGKGALQEFRLSTHLTTQLKDFSREKGVTLFMTMLAVFKVLLYRYTGVPDLCVGVGIANRRYKEMEGMLGMVINTLPLRTQVEGEISFIRCLNRVKVTCLEAYQHEDTPLGKIVEIIQPERSLSYNPLFQEMYTFMDTPGEGLRLPGLELELLPAHNRSSKFDINVVVVPPPKQEAEETAEILVEWEYNTDIFDTETVERMIGHYIHLLEVVVDNPDVSISNLPMLGREEIQRLLYEWNDTGADYPKEKTIHGLFEEQVERRPDRVALVGPGLNGALRAGIDASGGQGAFLKNRPLDPQKTFYCLTYRELNEKSNRLAHELIEKGVGPDTIVGIMAERSLEMMIGILGILKAGGAYMPIDPDYPRERIDYMLKDSNAKIFLAGQKIAGFNSPQALLKLSEGHNFTNDQCPMTNDHLAYAIYTSGSTGYPKGVLLQHRSVVNRLNWMQKAYPIDESDTLLQKTTYTFDVSVWEIFWWSMKGAKLCLVEPGGEKNPDIIIANIETAKVTVIHFVPSMLSVFLDYVKESSEVNRLSSLKYVIASGEALTTLHVNRFYQVLGRGAFKPPKLSNLYGPTEAAVDVSSFDCPVDFSPAVIPIGKPIDNIQLYVLDKHLYLQPVGIPGELCIAGDGLARGYLNRSELTAEKFNQDLWNFQDYQDEKKNYKLQNTNYKQIPNHKLQITKKKAHELHQLTRINQKLLRGVQGGGFLEKSPPGRRRQKIYKTGDLVRWLPDGNIEFLGRLDFQVKIRGFRIELGEIEDRLMKYPQVREAVVIDMETNENDKYLCAYLKVKGDKKPDIDDLQVFLSGKLPFYMIPGHFIHVETIPLTPSGKVDRKALQLQGIRLSTAVDFEEPGDDIEEKVAAIWKEILKLDRVGINDKFFSLGGNSINLIRVNTRLKELFNRDLPMTKMFEHPTIKSLSNYLKHLEKSGSHLESPGEKKIKEADVFQEQSLNIMAQTMQIIKGEKYD